MEEELLLVPTFKPPPPTLGRNLSQFDQLTMQLLDFEKPESFYGGPTNRFSSEPESCPPPQRATRDASSSSSTNDDFNLFDGEIVVDAPTAPVSTSAPVPWTAPEQRPIPVPTIPTIPTFPAIPANLGANEFGQLRARVPAAVPSLADLFGKPQPAPPKKTAANKAAAAAANKAPQQKRALDARPGSADSGGGGGGDAGDVGDTGDGDTKKTDRDTGDTWTWTGGGDTGTDRPLLVVAGGYDTRVDENVQYLQELRGVCERLGLRHATLQEGGVNRVGGVDVVFRRSIPSPERTALLMQTVALLYTPDREHFGIVPIEGMLLGVPVIAVNSGGPRETVVHGKTGYLCKQDAGEFADAMLLLLLAQTQGQAQGQREGERGGELGRTRSSRVKSASERGGTGTGGTGVVGVGVSMGEAARSHVRANFSYHSMRNSVQGILQQFAAEHLHLPNT